jgi:hypothetical protein
LIDVIGRGLGALKEGPEVLELAAYFFASIGTEFGLAHE